MRRVAVLGGGASGVLLALHLLRRPDPPEVTVVERSAELGAGAAYATRHPDHLLNVRASNMSAYPDEPGHFAAWLAGRPGAPQAGGGGFAPRRLYADYLAGLVGPALASGRLRRVRAEAVGARVEGEGVAVLCRDAAGRDLPALWADRAAVATGNEGTAAPPEPWHHAGWGDPGPCRVPADAPVVVVGTGLSMVDRALWLLHGGHRGPIAAVSRRGLEPLPHRAGPPPARLDPGEVPFGAPLPALLRWLRARARAAERDGGDWRGAVDALRPHTQALWRALPEAERRRFLRHAAPFWNAHRHRVAPPAAAALDAARRRGQLRILAGRVARCEGRGGGVRVTVERRGGGVERLDAAAVFECRGREGDVRRSANPLLHALLDARLARPDPLGLGLDVTDGCALLDADGRPSDRLFALGPVTAGTFWEVTAVPDIRMQAARLADAMAG